MAHWDDSGTAVGYEGKKGDKLILKSLSGKTKRKKKATRKKRVEPMKFDTKLKVVEQVAILESEEELEQLYQDFELDDNVEISDIVSGRNGEVEVEW